jgi:hypothetical protein
MVSIKAWLSNIIAVVLLLIGLWQKSLWDGSFCQGLISGTNCAVNMAIGTGLRQVGGPKPQKPDR